MGLRSRVRGALKPEYLYQPRYLLRRIIGGARITRGKHVFAIPGGAQLEADSEEEHGQILATLGVVDLPVTEALWRLMDQGETCADVGANIGYMTGILAARAGGGEVHSFEALPAIYEELKANIGRFRESFPNVRFHPHSAAVSDHAGVLRMEMPQGFDSNRGLARIGVDGSVEVNAIKLDDVFTNDGKIGVMKLDVEGHELSVLRGAEKLFREHRVRDCVFEEHRAIPTDVTSWLESHGYRIFRIARTTLGPVLVNAARPFRRVKWLPQNFVATADAGRAKRKFAPLGWASLRA